MKNLKRKLAVVLAVVMVVLCAVPTMAAWYDPYDITIDFVDEDGNEIASPATVRVDWHSIYMYGKLSSLPSVELEHFYGWVTDGDTSYEKVTTNTRFTEDTTLVAMTEKGVTINYYDLAHDTASESVVYGASATLLTLPDWGDEEFGYTLAGWTASGSNVTKKTLNFSVAERCEGAEYELYAKWNPIKWAVNFEDDGETETLYSEIQTGYWKGYNYQWDSEYAIRPATISENGKEGYHFIDWFVGERKYEEYDENVYTGYWNPQQKWVIYGPTTVTAVYEPNIYTITLDYNGGTVTEGEQIATFSQTFDATLSQLPADVYKSGYTFLGWETYKGYILQHGDVFTRASDIVLTAKFRYNGGGGGGTVKSSIPAGVVQGNWSYNPATDKWTFASNEGKTYHNEWADVYNPYATGAQPKASWYFFDAQGNMLTGYQWIPSLAGGYRLFYFHDAPDGDRGRMYASQATPDGNWTDATGWVYINGVLQQK